MRRAALVLGFALALFESAPARAQFLPEGGPGREQQEFATTVLLGPEAVALGGILGGAAVFGVEKNFTTKKGDDPAVVPIAIGAGVGAAIGATWAQWSISEHYHPGNKRNCAIGAAIGSAVGMSLYFGGPENQASNERALRLVAVLLAPPLAAYAGFHVGEETGVFEMRRPAPWSALLRADEPMARTPVLAATIRF